MLIRFIEGFWEGHWFVCLQNPVHARIETKHLIRASRKLETDTDFQNKILFNEEAHFWLNDDNPQAIVEIP